MMKFVKEVLFVFFVLIINLIFVVVGELRMSMFELEEKFMCFCKNFLDMINIILSMVISIIV